MKWNKTDTQTYIYKRDFDTFDRAWEFLDFVAKLCRSNEVYPEISTQGSHVQLELYELGSESFRNGVEDFFTDQKTKNVDKISTHTDTYFIYSDGGSRGNPGPSASGYVILGPDGLVAAEGGEFLGVTTNNQAEYQSLRAALDAALNMQIKRAVFHMDSMLVVNQVNGKYKVKNRDLWPIYESIKKDTHRFTQFELVHVPRELNKVADQKVNDILDEHIKA